MTIHDPAAAPRRRDQGYKGDAWSVDIPPDGDKPLVLLDTGLDSVAIVRIPDAVWERGAVPSRVHAHDGYDETILVTRGSGSLLHGPDRTRLEAERFEAPVVITVPAGWWHGVAMDPGTRAIATCFYTVTGTVIEKFAVQMKIIALGRVTFADLPVVHPVPVAAQPWTGGPPSAPAAPPPPPTRGARILAYPEPDAAGLTLPLDTGIDSLFIMAAKPGPEKAPSDGPPTCWSCPRRWMSTGTPTWTSSSSGATARATSSTATCRRRSRSPRSAARACWSCPPARSTASSRPEEDEVGDSILIYTARRAVVERHETIMARTTVAAVGGGGTPESERVKVLLVGGPAWSAPSSPRTSPGSTSCGCSTSGRPGTRTWSSTSRAPSPTRMRSRGPWTAWTPS